MWMAFFSAKFSSVLYSSMWRRTMSEMEAATRKCSLQTQVFACRMVVIRIEDFVDCLGGGVLTKGFDVVAAAEGIHVDGRALCAPYTQDADALAVIAAEIIISQGTALTVV